MTGGFHGFADAHHGIVGGNWKPDDNKPAPWSPPTAANVAPVGDGVDRDTGLQCVTGRVPANNWPGHAWRPDASDDGGTTWRHVSDSSFYAARFSPDGSVLWVSGNGRLGRYPAAALGW